MDELNPPVADWKARTVQTMHEKCGTCIFRPGNLMRLSEGRVREMLRSTLEQEGHITCHKTLTWKVGAICRGFIEADRMKRSLALRMIAAGVAREVTTHAEG